MPKFQVCADCFTNARIWLSVTLMTNQSSSLSLLVIFSAGSCLIISNTLELTANALSNCLISSTQFSALWCKSLELSVYTGKTPHFLTKLSVLFWVLGLLWLAQLQPWELNSWVGTSFVEQQFLCWFTCAVNYSFVPAAKSNISIAWCAVFSSFTIDMGEGIIVTAQYYLICLVKSICPYNVFKFQKQSQRAEAFIVPCFRLLNRFVEHIDLFLIASWLCRHNVCGKKQQCFIVAIWLIFEMLC